MVFGTVTCIYCGDEMRQDKLGMKEMDFGVCVSQKKWDLEAEDNGQKSEKRYPPYSDIHYGVTVLRANRTRLQDSFPEIDLVKEVRDNGKKDVVRSVENRSDLKRIHLKKAWHAWLRANEGHGAYIQVLR
ncbi:unnamed protein product [Sphenostylis stenocarpa]|uniref:Uncharacterized protein n=1 Tax=Sphenostylis stenocarpa TaxID=92480 RepID=A0AA86S3G5_9FABA|nr:unnamed protein product [Sphenostylis stenocarpa]